MSGKAKPQGVEPLAEAIAHEEQIRQEAAAVREEATATIEDASELTPALFLALHPLLTRPIPSAYIQHIPKLEKGKPYESTGIRSVQVQIDRMNNVLTPMWWWDTKTYSPDGKVCEVTVYVGRRPAHPEDPGRVLASGNSFGGVQGGSGEGNIRKGAYTNAAKLAFARLGPGHEVYLGAADLDPDVNQEVAEQQTSQGPSAPSRPAAKIGIDIAATILDQAEEIEAAKRNLRLAVSHIIGKDIGPIDDDRELALGALAEHLTFEQAEKLQRWIQRKGAEVEAEVAQGGSDE